MFRARKKKSPIVQTGMEANLDVSTLFIVNSEMFRTHKKVLRLVVLRHISDRAFVRFNKSFGNARSSLKLPKL